VSNAKLRDIGQEIEGLQQPDDQSDHHNAVQDSLDGALHRDETIHQPQQQADDRDYDNYVDNWQSVRSIRSIKAVMGIAEGYATAVELPV